MSAPYIIPFNFQPASVISLSNVGYTVPAGKYANVDYTLYSGVMLVNNDMVATGTSGFGVLNYGSGSTVVNSTAENTMLTATAPSQGYFTIAFAMANLSAGFTVTFRHRRGAGIIGQQVLTGAGAAVSTQFYEFVLSGDTFTAQLNSATNTVRSVTLNGDLNGDNKYTKEGSMWLNAGSVLTFSSNLPVSVNGIIQLFNSIS